MSDQQQQQQQLSVDEAYRILNSLLDQVTGKRGDIMAMTRALELLFEKAKGGG
jgi:hypothetical protein